MLEFSELQVPATSSSSLRGQNGCLMKTTVIILVSVLLAGVVFGLAGYALNLIQHAPEFVKRSLHVYGPFLPAMLVLTGAWLRRKCRNAEAE